MCMKNLCNPLPCSNGKTILKMVDILVFGSIITDFICYAPRLPKAGETLHGTKFQIGFGGKGANQCVAAARLGARTGIIGKVGADSFGVEYLTHLRTEGVNTEHVRQLKGETTGIAQITVSSEGENNIVIVVGANNYLCQADVTNAESYFCNAKVLICQLETPVDATIMALRSFKGISILNAAPALENLPTELLELASIFCVNESEAALIIGVPEIASIEDANAAIQRLIEMGGNKVIITMGKLGAVYAVKDDPTNCIHVAAPKVNKVVDTTGAGDAFIGALACSLSQFPERTLNTHIMFANKVASISVQHPGTQSSYPKGDIFK